jgi:multisubunit Na+/H+ antiporter MnhB subunit
MNEMRLSVDVPFEDIEAFSKWLQLRSRRVSDAILVLLVSIATGVLIVFTLDDAPAVGLVAGIVLVASVWLVCLSAKRKREAIWRVYLLTCPGCAVILPKRAFPDPQGARAFAEYAHARVATDRRIGGAV